MKKKFSSIIFDFGNVLLNLDLELSKMEMEDLLGSPYDVYHQDMPPIFRDFERGQISEYEFVEALRNISTRDFSLESFRNAWNAMLLDLPQSRLEMLERLKGEYKLYLFSNTNQTHLEAVSSRMGTSGFKEFTKCFAQCYFSFEIGHRKPDLEAFTLVLKDSQLIADETLFIDDGWMHIEGARAAGLNAVLHNPLFDISTVIDGYLNQF